jgi:hypothetical protein
LLIGERCVSELNVVIEDNMRTIAVLILIVLATCGVKGDTSLRGKMASKSLNVVEEAEVSTVT